MTKLRLSTVTIPVTGSAAYLDAVGISPWNWSLAMNASRERISSN
jgi:hypothetical protein